MPVSEPVFSPAIPLPAVLDQRTIEPARDLLASAADRGDLVLDASGVERLATVGVHLLLAAERTSREKGVAFLIDRPSAPFLETLSMLGLESHFAPWIKA